MRLARDRSLVTALLALTALSAPFNPTTTSGSQLVSGSPRGAVRVTAVVTDRSGRPVTNLRSTDFELSDDGVSQAIESVSPAGATPAKSAGRVFGILLDEFHVRAGASSLRVRETLSRFVSDELQPEDRVFVLKPLEPLTSIRFSTDRQPALSTIAGFDGRKEDYTPRTAIEEQLMGRAPALVQTDRARVVVAGVRELVAQIGRLRDRRGAVVFVSDGFSPPLPANSRPADVQTIVRLASRFDIPIYSFVPRAAADAPPASGPSVPESDAEEIAMLRALADATGGLAVLSGEAIDQGLRRMARDIDASYVLTYRPARPGDGKYHQLQIRTKRPDLEVRARPGYWAPVGDESGRTPGRTSLTTPARTRVLRRSPLVESWTGVTRTPTGAAEVTLTWEPRTRTTGSAQPRPDVIVVKACTSGGPVLFEGQVGSTGDAGRPGVAQSAVFLAPPGRIEIDFTILADDGRVLDTDARDLDIAAFGGTKPVLMPAQVFRARSAREFRDLAGNPAPPPVPSRVFFRTERLLIRAPAYDPAGGTLAVRATLLNALGQPVRALPAMATPWRGNVTQFDVNLGPFAPGSYEIELAVSSGTAEVKQRISFKLIG